MFATPITGAHADDAGIISFDPGAPLIPNFSIRTVLSDPSAFGVGGGAKYRAFGVLPASTNSMSRLAEATSNDGIHWNTPAPALIKDSTNANVPFMLNDSGGYLDVVYAPGGAAAKNTPQPFEIFYQPSPPIDPKTQQPSDNTTSIAGLHVAVSSDGITWSLDTALAQSGEPVVGGAAWKTGSYGPTDVIMQTVSGCPGTNFPWNCHFVMAYDTYGPASDGVRSFVGLAGSADGLTWTGMAAPALCPADPQTVVCGSATTWDQKYVTQAHIRKLSGRYEMYYAGGSGSVSECFTNIEPCWSVGVATSNDGVAWSKVVLSGDPAKPAIARAQLEAGGLNTPYTLVFPQAVDDQSISGDPRAKVYFSRVKNNGVRDVFLGTTASAPSAAGPTITIASPVGAYRTPATAAITVYLNDEFNTIKLDTLSLTIDGVRVNGATFSSSFVGALTRPGIKVSVKGSDLNLADGPHTLNISVADSGPPSATNPATASRSFVIDSIPTTTTITGSPAGTIAGYQLALEGSLGTFKGTIADAGSSSWNAVQKMRVVVTNPLGDRRGYISSNAFAGWTVTPGFPAHSATWRWVAPITHVISLDRLLNGQIPTLDPFYAIPGAYTVTISGIDLAGNDEVSSATNTVVVQAI